jgi:hypothetical protein
MSAAEQLDDLITRARRNLGLMDHRVTSGPSPGDVIDPENFHAITLEVVRLAGGPEQHMALMRQVVHEEER